MTPACYMGDGYDSALDVRINNRLFTSVYNCKTNSKYPF